MELPKQKITQKWTELFSIFKPLFQQKYFRELLKSKSLLPCRKDTSILLGEDSPLKMDTKSGNKKIQPLSQVFTTPTVFVQICA